MVTVVRALLAGLAIALAGCVDRPPTSSPMHDGVQVASPAGWVGYCLRHAKDDPRCRPSR